MIKDQAYPAIAMFGFVLDILKWFYRRTVEKHLLRANNKYTRVNSMNVLLTFWLVVLKKNLPTEFQFYIEAVSRPSVSISYQNKII